jgi:hypothetical protein
MQRPSQMRHQMRFERLSGGTRSKSSDTVLTPQLSHHRLQRRIADDLFRIGLA